MQVGGFIDLETRTELIEKREVLEVSCEAPQSVSMKAAEQT